jgi:alanyl-tRNA synthetase
MVQFKRLYSTADPLPYRRAVTVQPCLRAGGKDSDIENVGRTPRHLSFFQMLGNFSFGDYFKREAIEWGWDLLTREYGIDADLLWVSVYEDDDEAAEIWRTHIRLPAERIVRLGKADNFWGPAGKTGACGPSSEIHFDRGPAFGGEKPGDPGDRFLEVYNLVFPQFDMQESGEMAPLRNRGIDTGMGLERLTMILQGGETLFDTDQFEPILEAIEACSDRSYRDSEFETKRAMRAIADHVRGLTFTIGEGVMPSKEGRGYVMRRILRRAVRFGSDIGIHEPFLAPLSSVVVDHYQKQYPYLHDARQSIALVLKAEEQQFEATLASGERRFAEEVSKLRGSGRTEIPGAAVFRLYDTYGFPAELVEEMAADEGYSIDRAGFETALAEQQERSSAKSKFHDDGDERLDWTVVSEGASSRFVGYDVLVATSRVRRFAARGDDLVLVLDETPFYAESGGQIGDSGTVTFPKGTLAVTDTIKRAGEIWHLAREVPPGAATWLGDPGVARVDAARRANTERNHTATHLLHAALRTVLGTHVTQKGSFVGPDRLRFDFSHFQPMTLEEIRTVEEIVSAEIMKNSGVDVSVVSLKEALAAGAMALFGEKYGDTVRQVVVPGFSRELCGGTHVGETGEIGPFAIVLETSVASGVRRVEALTGPEAVRQIREERNLLGRLAGRVQSARSDLEKKIETLLAERSQLEKELEKARDGLRRSQLAKGDGIERVGDIDLLVQTMEAKDAGEMRAGADLIRGKLRSGVAILGANTDGKATFLVLVTKDLVEAKRFRADELVKAVAAVAGGSGGGKADLALAGAKEVDKIEAALAHGRELVRSSVHGKVAGA